MITMRLFVATCLGLCLIVASSVKAFSEDAKPVPSEMEIEVAIAQLEDVDTRLMGLETLIPLCGYGLPVQPALQGSEIGKRAAAAVKRCRNVETIGMALGSENVELKRWALRFFPRYPEEDFPDVDPARWQELVPQLRRLARSTDATSRGQAQGILRRYAGQREFLADLVKTETSANNVMTLLNYLDRSTYLEKMNRHVLRILSDENEGVRKRALLFVGFNSNRAPMWQFDFSDEVCRRVLELSYSPNASERAAAVSALDDLHDYAPEILRRRLLELARDSTDDVRWRIPLALRPYMAQSDVQEALARLLEDESPLVRYFTILVLGPEKHREQLRALAAGPDKVAAELAAGHLDVLEKDK